MMFSLNVRNWHLSNEIKKKIKCIKLTVAVKIFIIEKSKCHYFITIFKSYFLFALKQLMKTIESFWNILILPKPEDSLKKMLVQSITQFITGLKAFEQET